MSDTNQKRGVLSRFFDNGGRRTPAQEAAAQRRQEGAGAEVMRRANAQHSNRVNAARDAKIDAMVAGEPKKRRNP